MRRRVNPIQREQARNMRRNMTHHEKALWRRLNRNQLGVHFRRQHPIDTYIVDFAAFGPRLVVEVDGATHDDLARESLRDEELRQQGWRVVHFTNVQIEQRLDDVVARIAELVRDTEGPTTRDRSRS